MSIEVPVSGSPDTSEENLERDPRWLLVQRILKTETFQRAEQLRKILLYISRAAILRPDEIVREYDIAFNALSRRQNFDPAQDNIVRVQFTNLRRRLERYFVEEGKDEQLLVSIPRGSYVPVFLAAGSPATAPESEPQLPEAPIEAAAIPVPTAPIPTVAPIRWRRILYPLAGAALAGLIVLAISLFRPHAALPEKSTSKHFNAAFLQFLSRSQGTVSVVVPDTSEMMIGMITGADISAQDYMRRDFPEKQIATVKDPEVRKVLSELAIRRNTTAGEAKIAVDMVEALREAGVPSTFRYARDLHVRDLNDDNTILIGSRNSDPWVTLFASQMNFTMIHDRATNIQYFLNAHPLPGEQARYTLYLKDRAESENYGHIALMPNAAKSGFVLLVEGSDMESAEASANFLLTAQLNPEITALLTRKDLKYFEIFLRGRHLVGESEDSLEILSVRTTK